MDNKKNPKDNVKKRGALLNAVFAILIVYGILALLVYLFAFGAITKSHPAVPPFVLRMFELLFIIDLIFLLLLLMWKRWAFFGYIAMHVIAFVMYLILFKNHIYAVSELLFPIILYLAIRPKWKFFE